LNGFAQLTVLPLALREEGDLGVKILPQTRGMVDSTILKADPSDPFLVASLDWLWPRVCGDDRQIDGVKIDVQGMEVGVLKGMATTLRQHRPKLVIELHSGVSRQEFLDLLVALSYSQPGSPVDPDAGEVTPFYLDDRSYAFLSDQMEAPK
jgi:hypothetical protein